MPRSAAFLRRRSWPLVVGALATVLGAIVAIGMLKKDPEAPDPPQGPAPRPNAAASPDRPLGGIKARSLDPANLDDNEFFADPSRRAEFEQAADGAKDLAAELRTGQTQWSAFLIDMETTEDAVSGYMACAENFLDGTCDYTVDYVIEPKSGGEGQVVYAKASATPGPTPQCETFAKCMARERIGLNVRVPSDSEGLIAYRRARRESAAPSLFQDPQGAARSLEFLESALLRIKMTPDDLPDRDYRIAELEGQIRMFKTLAQRGKNR